MRLVIVVACGARVGAFPVGAEGAEDEEEEEVVYKRADISDAKSRSF